MKSKRSVIRLSIFSVAFLLFSSFFETPKLSKPGYSFPYKQAGLTERQAAAHLLGRFTYGAKPGEIDMVVKKGLETWFEEQLQAGLADDSLAALLAAYPSSNLSNTEIVTTYPRQAKLVRQAIKDGLMDKDSVNKSDKKEYRDQLQAYMQQNNMRPQQELFRELINQKILRASLTHNQLQEVLTDFWFNHFNVSITKNDCAGFIPAYERDVIRPNVTGRFENLLLATAKSPAMLLYLDNFSSSGTNTQMQRPGNGPLAKRFAARNMAQLNDSTQAPALKNKLQQAKKAQGLNENYAREVMELHTLGVDGGYTQADVTQAARVLTGWTVYPMEDYGYAVNIRKMIDKVGEDKMAERGFVHDGDFLFAMNRHDNGEKVVLGKKFEEGGGYEEGVELLKMLAAHPSTAKFICTKLATRFVSDQPSPALIAKMVKTYNSKKGDIKQVLITMASAPEFWSKDALREKTKSPFELAMSTVRSLNAGIAQPYQLYSWINKMGQKMYYYQAPTGFPDKGQYWINTGALLNRMNFGLAMASQRIPGVKVNLVALNNNHEPESAEDALVTYSKIMLPERDLNATVKRLTPLLNDPELNNKIDEAAGKNAPPPDRNAMATDMMMDQVMDSGLPAAGKQQKVPGAGKWKYAATTTANGNNSMLAQVVGIIIGSPEFQRK